MTISASSKNVDFSSELAPGDNTIISYAFDTFLDNINADQNIVISENFTTHLFPIDGHAPNDINAINNCLVSYFFALSIAQEALSDFLQNKYRSFDTLIGNNSCYISSYIIFLVSQKNVHGSCFRNLISMYIERIKRIKQTIIYETNAFSKKINTGSLSEFLEENKLTITLHPDCVYLVMSYGCTQSKTRNKLEVEETSCEKLLEIYNKRLNINIGRKSAQKLIKNWQKCLSILNIKTLRSHAQNTKDETAKLWANYVLNDRYILEDQRGRLCAPSLYSAMLIYEKLIGIPDAILGLQVNLIQFPKKYISRFTIYFQVQRDKNLKIIEQGDFLSSHPIYMFSGCRYVSGTVSVDIQKIREEFRGRDLKNLILSHEVTYPQYPKALNVKDILPQESYLIKEIEAYKKLRGFSIQDPTDLCLLHIFVDDTLTQSLAIYESPLYLPQLSDY